MSIHYLFLGNDVELKDEKLKQLKANIFKSPDAEKLDLETLDGHKLSSESLKVALTSVPALSIRRLVLIRRAEKLSKESIALIAKFLDAVPENPVLVLDALKWDLRSSDKKAIRSKLQVVGAAEKEGRTVFDMMDAVCAADTVGALSLLQELFERGERSENLVGGMLWSWASRMKGRLRADRYKKGLLVLQEADENLKRSRFPVREHAVEVAVVKLASLLIV